MADQVRTGRFIGRTEELAWLRELLGCAASGEPLVALITGEAGVGKTRLAEGYNGKLTPDQLERLRRIFPQGVCDYGKLSQNASRFLGTWLSFGG